MSKTEYLNGYLKVFSGPKPEQQEEEIIHFHMRFLPDGTLQSKKVSSKRTEKVNAYLEKRALRNAVSKSTNNNKKGARL